MQNTYFQKLYIDKVHAEEQEEADARSCGPIIA